MCKIHIKYMYKIHIKNKIYIHSLIYILYIKKFSLFNSIFCFYLLFSEKKEKREFKFIKK